MALGRKAVVFHNYNEGGGFSPFVYDPGMEQHGARPGEIKQLHEEFLAKNPYVADIDRGFRELKSPIEQLTGAFPGALVYNGTVSKGARERAKQAFNQDGSPSNLIIVQSDAGQAGISLHDTTGQHQRVLMNLGLPVRPTAAIQQEGRIYRLGQKSDALFRYMNTGTAWERTAFASKIAERAGHGREPGPGRASQRTLREAFINAFLDSAAYPPARGEGKGGKKADFDLAKAVTDYQKARSYYFAESKKSGRRDQREGLDYYPTPEPLGLKMAEWADIRSGDRVLEPSAGHGAIARFFPETADRTLIEPSADLASRAGLVAPGARVIQSRFEDLHAVNKYDAIVMNPPFGHAGATAIDHVARAMTHLKDGGRIVALIPHGAADGRLEKLMESDAARGVYKVADIDLPPSTFERAGTKVNAHVVVLERQNNPELAQRLQETHRDFSDAPNINALFDRMEDTSIKERLAPKVAEGGADRAGARTPLRSVARRRWRAPARRLRPRPDRARQDRRGPLRRHGAEAREPGGVQRPQRPGEEARRLLLQLPRLRGDPRLPVQRAARRARSFVNDSRHRRWPEVRPRLRSPHDFDQFSMEHIGKGEGAQAYGHGLYFAGEKAVAEHYREGLAPSHGQCRMADGREIDEVSAVRELERGVMQALRHDLPESRRETGALAPYEVNKTIGDVTYLMRQRGRTLKEAIAELRAHEAPGGFSQELRDKTLDWMEKSGIGPARRGRLYHVEIPEPHEYLDRDLPMNDQSSLVRAQLRPLGEAWALARHGL